MENDLIIAERQEAYKTIEDLASAVASFSETVKNIFIDINKNVSELGDLWEGSGYERLKEKMDEQIRNGNSSLKKADELYQKLVERAVEVKEFIEFIKDL